MKCFGCKRELEVGDRYIADTASGFTDNEADTQFDDLIADLMGGAEGKIVFCEDCCTTDDPDGRYLFDTVYGDECVTAAKGDRRDPENEARRCGPHRARPTRRRADRAVRAYLRERANDEPSHDR